MSAYEPVVRRERHGWAAGVRGPDGMVLPAAVGYHHSRRAAAKAARSWAERLNETKSEWEAA